MGKQVHKRLPKDFIENVIRTFCDKGMERSKLVGS